MSSLNERGESPLVSVIIPTYNRAHVLERAIASVIQQTYKNIEVIVVDDGSTDDTAALLTRYHAIIHVIKQTNRGPSHARNRGIQAAHGEIIAFLDSDDAWLPEKLARQVDLLVRLDASVACCLCNAEMRFTHRPRGTSFENAGLHPREEEGIWLNPAEVLMHTFVLFNQTAAIRRSALEETGGFDEEIKYLEDYDLALRLSLLGPWGFIQEQLVTWHQGFDSASREALHDVDRLKKNEVTLRQKILTLVDRQHAHAALRGSCQRALNKALRGQWAARIRQKGTWRASAVCYAATTADRYMDALLRRSPWAPKMITAPVPGR